MSGYHKEGRLIPLTHSLTHSLTHARTHSPELTHSLTHSLTHTVADPCKKNNGGCHSFRRCMSRAGKVTCGGCAGGLVQDGAKGCKGFVPATHTRPVVVAHTENTTMFPPRDAGVNWTGPLRVVCCVLRVSCPTSTPHTHTHTHTLSHSLTLFLSV